MSAVWRCGTHLFALSRPYVMGIVNTTPDSFSDGGDTLSAPDAIAAGRRKIALGADMIDVGGESTRPGSDEVSAVEELDRVRHVVETLSAEGVCVSVDTRHPEVAAGCVRAGASVINDIAGFRDPEMVRVAAASDAGLVVMHMLGEPKTMQGAPVYDDVVAEVRAFLEERVARLREAGVEPDRICVDPGLGFGKTTAHNLELLRRLDEIASLGYPVLIGASRKRFIGEITGEPEPRDRVGGSVGAAVVSMFHAASVVRVHDVAETAAALRVAYAVEHGTW